MAEVKNYPPYLDYPKPYKAQTNADRIRAMSEEELGKFLLSCCDWNLLIGDVCSEDNCAECHEEISTCSGNCFPAVVKWLQQTVK